MTSMQPWATMARSPAGPREGPPPAKADLPLANREIEARWKRAPAARRAEALERAVDAFRPAFAQAELPHWQGQIIKAAQIEASGWVIAPLDTLLLTLSAAPLSEAEADEVEALMDQEFRRRPAADTEEAWIRAVSRWRRKGS